MFMSHSCVDFTFVPSGKFIVIGLLVFCLLLTGATSIMNTFVAPVSAIACDISIVIAFRHCQRWEKVRRVSLSSRVYFCP